MFEKPVVKLESELPSRLEINKGACLFVKGFAFIPDRKIRTLKLKIGSDSWFDLDTGLVRKNLFEKYHGFDRNGHSLRSGFEKIVEISEKWIGKKEILYLVLEDDRGETHEIELGEIEFVSVYFEPLSLKNMPRTDQDIVTICLATYNPEENSLKRQIDSIKNQTFKNWICIINDDCSNKESYETIKKIAGEDERIFLFRNNRNQGFYRNFEIALRRVPKESKYIALCDQDDEWYPDKIEKTLSRFKQNVQLVYSDMRIVDQDGEILSSTYWEIRKNNYTDFRLLLMANTVTGAASIFRADMLDSLLPFPDEIGNAFHDHWIACVAYCKGQISYIDEPLYDYIQYQSNVIGHCDFDAKTLVSRLQTIGIWAGKISSGVFNAIIGRSEKGKFQRDVTELLARLDAIYRNEYMRLQFLSRSIGIRFRPEKKEVLSAIKIFEGTWYSVWALLKFHISVLFRRQTSNDVEIRLLISFLAARLNGLFWKLFSHRLIRRYELYREKDGINNSRVVEFLENKIRPIEVIIDNGEPIRINILVPEISSETFFGGYLAKFYLAEQLLNRGIRIRMIIVDSAQDDTGESKREMPKSHSTGNENCDKILKKIELVDLGLRESGLRFNKQDKVVATTWWTAFIANSIVSNLSEEVFLYLIQEYEPLTVPHGSYYALAKQSYTFKHRALFSTPFLAKYFEQNKYGVFSAQGTVDFRVFQNAILNFDKVLENRTGRTKRRLVFYARSDSHAARNLFELGLMALRRMVGKGEFSREWEFVGCGTTYGRIDLGQDVFLEMIGKLSLDTYKDLLRESDIGISLMYTPHPSLVPLEMAAAGMLVVTTNYENKDRRSLAAISTNLIGCESTIEAIESGISTAISKAEDYSQRKSGSRIDWPSKWGNVFDDEIIAWAVNEKPYSVELNETA